MTNEFEAGMEYERNRSERFQKLFLGYSCIIFSFISLFGVFLTKTLPTWFPFFLLIIGFGSLWVGYNIKLKNKKKKK